MTNYVRGSGVGPMPTAGIWCGRPSGLDIGRSSRESWTRSHSPSSSSPWRRGMLEAPLYRISRVHIELLTDEIGIFQHSVGSRPDPMHGYCVDDVARALQVDLLHGRELGWDAVATSAWRSFT